LRTAFSMTVEPLWTSSSWRVPSKAMMVSFGMVSSGFLAFYRRAAGTITPPLLKAAAAAGG
jgi:hypothetical protein